MRVTPRNSITFDRRRPKSGSGIEIMIYGGHGTHRRAVATTRRSASGRATCPRWSARSSLAGRPSSSRGRLVGGGEPLAVWIASASPHEVLLVEKTLDALFIDGEHPDRVIGDKAYDSDPLDERLLVERGVELIAPNIQRRGRRRRPPQDKRPLR